MGGGEGGLDSQKQVNLTVGNSIKELTTHMDDMALHNKNLEN